MDHFTRYAHILTSGTQNANDFIRLIRGITTDNKIGSILADQYPGINSKEFKDFLDKENTILIFTAVNAPFSNGLNERLNQTLINKIRCRINEKKEKTAWTTVAHECVRKYNKTEHTITGFSPEYLLEGTNTAIIPEELKQKRTHGDLLEDRKIALQNTRKSHEYNKKIFNKNRKHHEFNVSDLVYVENGHRLNRGKLDELKIGPYKITEKVSNFIFKIQTDRKKSESLFHITKLTPVTYNEK